MLGWGSLTLALPHPLGAAGRYSVLILALIFPVLSFTAIFSRFSLTTSPHSLQLLYKHSSLNRHDQHIERSVSLSHHRPDG